MAEVHYPLRESKKWHKELLKTPKRGCTFYATILWLSYQNKKKMVNFKFNQSFVVDL